MSGNHRHRWARFAASMIAGLTLLVAAPLGLLAASLSRFGSGNPLYGLDAPWRWVSSGVGDAVSRPIADDTVIDGIVRLALCVAWIAIAVIVATTLAEVVHAIRHRGIPLPDVHGLGWAQAIGRFIAVGLIAVLPLASSSTSLASSLQARAVASAAPTSIPASMFVSDATATFGASPTVEPATSDPSTGSVHRVRPGESIYSIAVGLAGGDSSQVIAIADAIIDANLGAVMPGGQRFTNPAYIEVGWTLQIPTPGPASVTASIVPEDRDELPATYTVEHGDTLWDIADEQLGDPFAWPQIWQRNAGDDMGDGHSFDDPDLILPGWELELRDTVRTAVEPAAEVPIVVETWDPPAPAAADTTAGSTGTPPTTVAEATDPTADPTTSATTTTPATAAATPAATASTTTTSTTSSSTSSTSTTTTSVAPPTDGSNSGADDPVTEAPSAPSPIRIEHAAMVAAGILALVAVRRRRRLRSATPRHRVPEPRPDVTDTERRLRTIDAGERSLRVDVACRAAAWSLIDTGSQIGWIEVSTDGDLDVRLTAPAALPMPWTGEGQDWRLGAEVPIELLAEDARQVGQPCVALVQLGITPHGCELMVDLEACGVLAVVALPEQGDDVVTAVATALASSLFAEVAHLIGVSLPESALLNHRNAHVAASADAAFELAAALAGSTALDDRSTFDLRSRRTGGEMWEPAVVLLRSGDHERVEWERNHLPGPGHGLAIVLADEHHRDGSAARLVARSSGWQLDAFGSSIDLTPIGVGLDDLAEVTDLLADAERDLEPIDPPTDSSNEQILGTTDEPEAPFESRPHEIVVGLLGGVEVHSREGEPGSFERSKTVELLAWLATHRDRATRTGARTALWELDVRDATFANVVSEARRGLARLVAPPDGEEWVGRTLTEQLPLHDLVVTDSDLVHDRLARARLQPPNQAIETLRPAVALVRDMPFAGTSYLWPDAEGITSNLVLLAISAAAEFAGHALSLGDTDGVFWATGQGLRVLPGHEELIALRMRAHARSGDLAGIRQEWESYERVLVADAWSDGEPAPKLLALRRELLDAATP